jgi:hypothetical protein
MCEIRPRFEAPLLIITKRIALTVHVHVAYHFKLGPDTAPAVPPDPSLNYVTGDVPRKAPPEPLCLANNCCLETADAVLD